MLEQQCINYQVSTQHLIAVELPKQLIIFISMSVKTSHSSPAQSSPPHFCTSTAQSLHAQARGQGNNPSLQTFLPWLVCSKALAQCTNN